jgi:type IV secretion system protein VirB2
MKTIRRHHPLGHLGVLLAVALLAPTAWAGSPFAAGATAAQTNLVTILTPVAVIAVMVSGVLAWFGKIAWWWMVGVVIGIILVFGSQQIVEWVRSLAGV